MMWDLQLEGWGSFIFERNPLPFNCHCLTQSFTFQLSNLPPQRLEIMKTLIFFISVLALCKYVNGLTDEQVRFFHQCIKIGEECGYVPNVFSYQYIWTSWTVSLTQELSNEMIMTRELFVILLISSVKTYNVNKEYFIHCMKIASICKYVWNTHNQKYNDASTI